MALSKYDLSNEIKTSTELGVLTPIHWQDVVPGDKIRCQSKSIIRLQPLLSPVYNSISYNVRYYYIPYRLLIKDFGRFLVEAENSSLSLPMLYDHVKADEVTSSFNYLRLFGINWSGDLTDNILRSISALPFRALHLVYNYYFKNELLDDSYIDMMMPDQFGYPQFKGFQFIAPLFATYYSDYFTDAYPTPQVGTPVNVDLDSDNQILVPEIDFATRLQRFKERLLLVGKSYRKFLQRFHGVTVNSDLLDVPRLIGSASQILNISDVDQVAPSEDEPVGSTYGKSVTVASNFGYTQDFNEHGIVLGLSYVLPSTSYVQGIPREFQKKTRFDFFTPDFASVGMQELRGNELSAERTDTFGYTPRYGELRQSKNIVAGDFTDSLSYWHFGRSLRSEKLSNDFIKYHLDNRPFSVVAHEFIDYSELYLYVMKKEDEYILAVSSNKYEIGWTVGQTGFSPVWYEPFGNRYLVYSVSDETLDTFSPFFYDLNKIANRKDGMLDFYLGFVFKKKPTNIDRGPLQTYAFANSVVIGHDFFDRDRQVSLNDIKDLRDVVLAESVIRDLPRTFFDNGTTDPDDFVSMLPVTVKEPIKELKDIKISRDVIYNHLAVESDVPAKNYVFSSEPISYVFNHVLIANFNKVDALRPIPKLEF